jgi:hypothetical protein
MGGILPKLTIVGILVAVLVTAVFIYLGLRNIGDDAKTKRNLWFIAAAQAAIIVLAIIGLII